jgi:hypothetical protein
MGENSITPPIEVNGIEQPTKDELILTYDSEEHNVVIRRTYERSETTLHSSDEEFQFDFTRGEWNQIHEHTHKYDLNAAGTRLVGDGSGWDGDGKKWVEYFVEQHFHRLDLRLTEDINEPTSDMIPPTHPLTETKQAQLS